MNVAHDYESMNPPVRMCVVLEAWKGTDIVTWYDNIKRQLETMVADYEKAQNFVYRDRVHKFIDVWDGHKLDGSINVEPIQTLQAASLVLSGKDWPAGDYFSKLSTNLKALQASQEELPVVVTPPGPKGSSGAPRTPFGADKDVPPLTPPDGTEDSTAGKPKKPGEEGAQPPPTI